MTITEPDTIERFTITYPLTPAPLGMRAYYYREGDEDREDDLDRSRPIIAYDATGAALVDQGHGQLVGLLDDLGAGVGFEWTGEADR